MLRGSRLIAVELHFRVVGDSFIEEVALTRRQIALLVEIQVIDAFVCVLLIAMLLRRTLVAVVLYLLIADSLAVRIGVLSRRQIALLVEIQVIGAFVGIHQIAMLRGLVFVAVVLHLLIESLRSIGMGDLLICKEAIAIPAHITDYGLAVRVIRQFARLPGGLSVGGASGHQALIQYTVSVLQLNP